jgi:ribonuclease BN (tRNA processing enzyme)
MLTLTFLGVGSAFAKRNFQSNALVEAWSIGPQGQSAPDETLLIDFGGTGPLAFHQLKGAAGFAYLDRNGRIHYPAIGGVFITHLHSDHIGGLEELAVLNALDWYGKPPGTARKPRIFGSKDLLGMLWENSLKGGLGVIAGERRGLADFFDVVPLDHKAGAAQDRFCLMERYDFIPFPTDHIRLRRKYDWPSYGLLIRDRTSGQSVVYSGDTRFDPDGMLEKLAGARLVFHEVQLEDDPDPVHALLTELCTLDSAIRSRMILYHYGDSWGSEQFSRVSEEFMGFARPHYRYTLFP